MDMGHKSKKPNPRPVIVALILSAVMLVAGIWAIEGLTAAHIGRRIAWPLVRLLLAIAVGLAAGQLIEAAGWTRKLGALGAPLFRFARLGPHCSAAFTTAFISGEASNAMLLEHWKEGRIDRFQMVLTNLANQVPAFFLHLPSTIFMVLPLTGWAGGLYFIITFLAALLRLLAVLLVGRFRLAPIAAAMPSGPGERPPRRSAAVLWATVKQKLPARLMGVATYVVPIYIAVFLLNSAGLFEWTQAWLVRGFSSAFIPVEALSLVVLSFTAEFASGFAAAGALMHEGVISTKQAVLALLIGNIVAFPVRALRHQLPRLLGIFAPRMGMTLLLLGQGTRVVSLIIVGGVYWVLF
jgi:hypothetical protein